MLPPSVTDMIRLLYCETARLNLAAQQEALTLERAERTLTVIERTARRLLLELGLHECSDGSA